MDYDRRPTSGSSGKKSIKENLSDKGVEQKNICKWMIKNWRLTD